MCSGSWGGTIMWFGWMVSFVWIMNCLNNWVGEEGRPISFVDYASEAWVYGGVCWWVVWYLYCELEHFVILDNSQNASLQSIAKRVSEMLSAVASCTEACDLGVSESHSTFLRQKWRGHQGIHHREYQSTHELFRDVSDDAMAFVSCLYSIEYRYTAEQALTRPWLQLRSRKIAAYQRWG